VRRQGDVRNAPSLLRLHVRVHEGRMPVLHDDRRRARMLRLLLLVASMGSNECRVRATPASHRRGFTVTAVRPLFRDSLFYPIAL
jgi:hypothetical protein